MHLAPDTLLQNRYRIQRLIAQGGMGAVYQARDERLGNIVAIKQTLVGDPQLRAAFAGEARLLAHLQHPALPIVSDHFAENNEQFLVMQFIPGDDLATLLAQRKQPFPLAEVLPWADRLLDALDYLHTQNPPIIHRDIKPLNLKLSGRGELILLDFGLAKGAIGQLAPDQPAGSAPRSIFGYTPQYAPLEQIQGRGTDPRSDLYAAAATFYELLTGSQPPDALTRAAAMASGQLDPLQSAHLLRPEIPPGVGNLLYQAMALPAEQRPASAAAMRLALQAATRPQGQVAPGSHAPTHVGPSSAGQPTIVMAGGGAASAGPTLAVPTPPLANTPGARLLLAIVAAVILLLTVGALVFMRLNLNAPLVARPDVQASSGPALPQTISGSREQPLSPDALVQLPGWEVRLVEQVRGDDAWRMMRAANQFNDLPPDGFEYLLLRLEVRTLFSGEERQLYPEVVGSRRVEYARSGVAPEPAFPQEALGGGQTINGYLPFIVGVEENRILLKLDELLGPNDLEPVFVALTAGDSLPDDPALAAIEPNRVGADLREPADLGERAVLEDWEVTIREVIRGDEALDRLISAYDKVERPAAGREYALAYVAVRYIGDGGFGDDTEHANRDLFKSATISGSDVAISNAPPVYILPDPELAHWLYPGGSAEGWVVIDLPQGEAALLVFSDGRSDGDPLSTRYFALPEQIKNQQ